MAESQETKNVQVGKATFFLDAGWRGRAEGEQNAGRHEKDWTW